MNAVASSRMHAVPPSVDELEGVWRGDQLAQQQQALISSGHPELDPELPGRGWPLGQLTEILQAQPGLHEWRLLLPALRQAIQKGPLVLIGPPQIPNLSALAASGLPSDRVLLINANTPAERLWSAEQILRSQELGALLAWLPQARSEQLRRLQLASGSTQALVFAFRPEQARHESSPAPLRLCMRASQEGLGLSVEIVKRRGPHIDHAVTLEARLPVMAVLRKRRIVKDADHAVDRPATEHTERRRSLQLVTA